MRGSRVSCNISKFLCSDAFFCNWIFRWIIWHFPMYTNSKQGHRHSGDQAARRLHILCLICVHWSLSGTFRPPPPPPPPPLPVWGLQGEVGNTLGPSMSYLYLGIWLTSEVFLPVRPTRIRWRCFVERQNPSSGNRFVRVIMFKQLYTPADSRDHRSVVTETN